MKQIPQGQWQLPPQQPQQYNPHMALGRTLVIASAPLVLVAAMAFSYLAITYYMDVANPLMLLADVYSLVKIGIIGFACFFLSYLLLAIAIFLERW